MIIIERSIMGIPLIKMMIVLFNGIEWGSSPLKGYAYVALARASINNYHANLILFFS